MLYNFSKGYRPYIIFFLLLLVPFGAFFLREDFKGNDSYFYLLQICEGKNYGMDESGIDYFIFSSLPCNFIALKALLFALCFVSGCFIIRMATLFSPRSGWKASYVIFLSATFILKSTNLENDPISFPFLFASLYFFWSSMKTQNRKHLAYAFGLLIIAGLLWGGAVYYLFAYAINFWVLWIGLIPFLAVPFKGNMLFWQNLLGTITRTNQIAEDLPLKLMQNHFVLNFGIWGLVFCQEMLPSALLIFVIGLVSNKFWILSTPFLVVGAIKLIEQINRQDMNVVVAVVCIFMVFAGAQSVYTNPPTQDDWAAIDYVLESGKKYNNPWGVGYWVLFKGGDTNSFGSFHRQTEIMPNELVLSYDRDLDCRLLKKYGQNMIYQC